MKLKNILSEIKLIRQIPIYNNSDNNEWDLYINDKKYDVYETEDNYTIYNHYNYSYELNEVKLFLDSKKIPYIDGVDLYDYPHIIVEKIYFKII